MLSRLIQHEAFAGVLMMLAAAIALALANSGLADGYHAVLNTKFTIALGEAGLSKPLILWINDGLMAVFFFLIGLELKREMVEGRLKNPRDVMLPGVAALGGMLAPMLVFLAVTRAHPELHAGWAIPAATDIAFAVGVLALLGKRVPPGLKIFLLTLAILDDMGAIVIIALFYGSGVDLGSLALAAVPLAGLIALNLRGSHRIAPFLLLGAVMWFFVLKSGIHPTIAGVVTAFCIPLTDRFGKSPLHALEHGLHPYVNFGIAPVFALANAGVNLSGLALSDLIAPLPLGIAAGLFLGKQIGVFGATFAMVKLGLGRLPQGTTWAMVWGLSMLAGIGFTMSLFIGSLSYEGDQMMNMVRLGVLLGSAVAAVAGYAVLRTTAPRARPD
ncbi:Na+/H+ antiporter NhaA [Rhodobacteraceae bacterium KMS-5]|uniref:Na(+)/H(+) antiporter NhaA n=1 Tax=Tabrizicola oligotrophica TaxID=2710650 RepID=A0A6M0QVJ9_9RHOB|nr:Na+/H+ antiporter NhaA [Tabrizicola oligotrophica]